MHPRSFKGQVPRVWLQRRCTLSPLRDSYAELGSNKNAP